MIDDQKQRENKKIHLIEEKKKNDEDNISKSMMSLTKKASLSRTHSEFMADQIKHEMLRFEKLKQILEKEE
jgi:hypothetical protein